MRDRPSAASLVEEMMASTEALFVRGATLDFTGLAEPGRA